VHKAWKTLQSKTHTHITGKLYTVHTYQNVNSNIHCNYLMQTHQCHNSQLVITVHQHQSL